MSNKLLKWIPVIEWIPKYHWKYLQYDLIAGLTLSTVIIPQSLAYGALAGLPAVYGLYCALIPPVIYFLFGTSPYNSVGTFAITSILIAGLGSVAIEYKSPNADKTQFLVSLSTFTAFLVGSIGFLTSIIRGGAWISKHLLRDEFISGFTSAAAITIITSQLKPLLGLQIPQFLGPFSVVKTWAQALSHLNSANWVTCVISISSFLLMLGVKQLEIYLRRRFSSHPELKIVTVFPEVLFTVVLMSGITNALDLPEDYGVEVIGDIPSGFPSFMVPWSLFDHVNPMYMGDLWRVLIPKVFSLAIICLVTLSSIQKTFPSPVLIKDIERGSSISLHRLQSTLSVSESSLQAGNMNQEFFALSLASIIGSFFNCFVPTSSLSKAAILANATNVRSPLGSLISVGVVAIVIAFLTSWFEGVPKAVLAAIVVLALIPVASKMTRIRNLIEEAKVSYKKVSMDTLHNKSDQEPHVFIIGENQTLENNENSAQNKNVEDLHQEFSHPSAPTDLEETLEKNVDREQVESMAVEQNENAHLQGNSRTLRNYESVSGLRREESEVASQHPSILLTNKQRWMYALESWDGVIIWIITFVIVVVVEVGAGVFVGIGLVAFFKLLEKYIKPRLQSE